MGIPIDFFRKEEILAKLCVYAYKHGWRLNYTRLDVPAEINTIDDAKKVIEAYGQLNIERSLDVDLSGLYFDPTSFNMRFGSAHEALYPERYEKLS